MFGLCATASSSSSPRRTTPKYLPNVEVFIYMYIYVAFIAYGGWQLYQYGNVILRHAESSDFHTGWTWLFAGNYSRRPQENDDEWLHWTTYLIRHWPWFLGHAIAVEVSGFSIASATHRSYINAALGCAFFAHCNGLAITAAMVLYICVCHRLAVSPARRKCHIWLMAGLLMALLTAIKSETLIDLWLDPQTSTENEWIWDLCVIGAWTVCRMLSACLDTIDGIAVSVEDVAKTDDETAAKPPTAIDVIAYILYIPTLLYGPVLNFKRYQAMQQQRKRADFTPLHKRLVVFAGNCVRLVVLYGTIELLAHTFYVNALHVNAALVERMPVTALYAYGYAMGMRFYLKYVFVYGWSLALCRLQGMPSLPPLPRCIGRVHLYSDMWKWFDVGLYEFLFQYIYAALCRRDSTAARKLFASSATFVFIFLFHGMYDYVLVWSVLNYLCIVLEMLGRAVCTSEAAASSALSVPMQRRIVAVFGSQLQLLAILSNFFFFGGRQVGWIFVWRTYGAIGWPEYGGLSLCMLCIYHTSEWLKRKEEHGQRQRID